MAEKNYLAMAIIAFIVVIVGVALLSSVSDTTSSLTEIQTATNDSFTGINATAVTVSTTGFEAVSAVRNSTHDTLTLTTDYTVNTTAGTITVLTGNGTYYADYTYKTSQYVENSPSRSVINLIVLFFALAILGGVWMFAFDGLEKLGFKK